MHFLGIHLNIDALMLRYLQMPKHLYYFFSNSPQGETEEAEFKRSYITAQ
jgi:hypothetical protein